MTDFYTWTQAEPRALARCVRPADLVPEFDLPVSVNRLNLLQDQGPPGLAAALYNQVVRCALNYDLAPFDPRAGVVQQIRTPARILKERRATCLDLAVLFAAQCLANDLLSLLVLVDGHALAGVSLTRQRHRPGRPPQFAAWDRGLLADREVLQAGVDDEYLLVECTGMARSRSLSLAAPEGQGRDAGGTLSFERACQAGAEHVLQAPERVPTGTQRRFLYVLDVHDLQVQHGFEPEEDDMADNESESGGVSISSQGNVHIGGDVVGRDKITHHSGDHISVGDISGSSGIAIGRGATTSVTSGAAPADLAAAFALIYQKIQSRPDDPGVERDEIAQNVRLIEKESTKAAAADEHKLERWVKHLMEIAPDIVEVLAAAFAGPASAAGTILKKVIERARAQAS